MRYADVRVSTLSGCSARAPAFSALQLRALDEVDWAVPPYEEALTVLAGQADTVLHMSQRVPFQPAQRSTMGGPATRRTPFAPEVRA